MIAVLQIFRKRNPVFFSIEKVFSIIEPQLGGKINLKRLELPYFTSGLLSIFRNLFYLQKTRFKGVCHVTGDVHYALFVLPPARTVLTIHDCVFLHTTKGVKRKILKWLFLDMPVKRAAIVTTISEFSRQEILRFTHCPADKVIVIPNPVNETIRYKEQDFNAAKPVIFFIGTTPNKNLERVVPALQYITCRLCILGKLTESQQQLLEQYAIDFSVVSNVSETALADLYAAADIVLFPSLFEGFGLPILEAQQAGRIVITSNIDPMKTVAGGGALLIDPFNTEDIKLGIQTIIADQDLRNRLIKKGFENTAHYQAKAVAADYYKLYGQLAAATS